LPNIGQRGHIGCSVDQLHRAHNAFSVMNFLAEIYMTHCFHEYVELGGHAARRKFDGMTARTAVHRAGQLTVGENPGEIVQCFNLQSRFRTWWQFSAIKDAAMALVV